MFAYCGNNPVARIDSSGEFFFTILGAVVGGFVGAVDAWLMGKDVLKGALSGAVSGAISGAGVDIGVAMTAASGGTLLLAGLGVAGALGAIGSAVGAGISSDWEADPVEYLAAGVVGGLTNMLSFGLAPINGEIAKAGVLTVLKESVKIGSKDLAMNATTGAIVSIGATWINRVLVGIPVYEVFP